MENITPSTQYALKQIDIQLIYKNCLILINTNRMMIQDSQVDMIVFGNIRTGDRRMKTFCVGNVLVFSPSLNGPLTRSLVAGKVHP